jgi:hypothetical protein
VNAETIQLYLDLIKNVEILNKCIQIDVRADVIQANKAYYEAEQELAEKYGYDYEVNMSDFRIPSHTIKNFKIIEVCDSPEGLKVPEDKYMVRCHAEDRNENQCSWIITIPFDMTQLPDFVKSFKQRLEQITMTKLHIKNTKKMVKDQKEFERLKTKLQENLGDNFSTIPVNQTTEHKPNPEHIKPFKPYAPNPQIYGLPYADTQTAL